MVQYAAHLQTHLLQELRTSDISSLDKAISVLDDKLLSRLLLKQRPLRELERPERVISAKEKALAEKQRAAAKATAALAKGQAKPGSKGSGKGSGKDASAITRKPVCFDHDQQAGLSCSGFSDKSCTKDHLDTSKPDQRSRYDFAKEAFAKRQLKKSSGK